MTFWNRFEISDLIIQHEPHSCQRIPVHRADAMSRCGSWYARKVIKKIPHNNGILCEKAVDDLLVQAHGELQRLWEEFYHAQRVATILEQLVRAVRNTGIRKKLRVVDIGCASGYVLRWLAAHRVLHNEIELIGVDFNQALIQRAKKLAAAENLCVEFLVANAFSLKENADIFLSSGVLHHIDKEDLVSFFDAQSQCNPLAFAHFDPQASWASPVGSFLFHFARMRTSLARYDGWLSAARAHRGVVLEEATKKGVQGLSLFRYNPPIFALPFIRTLTGVLGVIPQAKDCMEQHMHETIRIIRP